MDFYPLFRFRPQKGKAMHTKTIFALFGLGFLGLQALPCAAAGESKPPLQVTVEVVTSKDGPMVTLTVKNVSDTYQIYQSISCSWQDFWQTDDKNTLLMGQQECGKNSPFTAVLAPGEKHIERKSPVMFRGKPGKHTVRFGYSRHVSDFTSAELKRVHDSDEKYSYFSGVVVASRFKPVKETFWSAPVTLTATKPSILH